MKGRSFLGAHLRLGLVAVTLLAPARAGAAIRYVSITGRNEYPYLTPESAARSIQVAVDASQEGDEVVVHPGPYLEHVVLKRCVNLFGSGRDEVTIYGVTPVKPVLTLTWNNSVEGLTIVGSPYAGVGIYAELGVPPAKTGTFRPFRITDCSVRSCGGPGILMFARQELGETFMPDPQTSSPGDWQRYLASIYNTKVDIQISRCQITGCGGAGITLAVEDLFGRYGGCGWPELGCTVQLGFKEATLRLSQCTVADCTGNGVVVRAGWWDAAWLVMDRCVIRNNNGRGVYVASEGAVWGGAVVEANNCVVSGNRRSAIWCFSIDDGVYEVPGGEVIGVEPSATGDVIVTSSTITGNSVGLVGAPFPPGSEGGGMQTSSAAVVPCPAVGLSCR